MRFECQSGCQKCCTRGGAVYLTEDDLQRAADYMGLAATEFESRYVIRFRHLLRLRRPAAPQTGCQFLGVEGCTIHAVKPRQCRTYPFWPSLVSDRGAWAEEARFCPGMGQGQLVHISHARQQARELTEAFPTLKVF